MKKLLLLLLLVTFDVFAGIPISSNFTMNAALPIEDRMSVADLTARDALSSLRRWEGMLVYVVADQKHYTLIGGITNGDWTELSGGGAGGANLELWVTAKAYAVGDTVIESNKIYYALIAHTSGTFATDLAATRWVELSAPVLDHTLLTNIGTNTHAQIDTHIASTSNPHSVTKTQVGLGNVLDVDTTTTANITDSTNKRFVTDANLTTIGSAVVGPASATDNAVTRFDATTGKLVQNSLVTIGDTGNVTGIADLSISGTGTIGSLTGVIKGASGVLSASAVNLTSEVTGVLPILNGGTGSSTKNFVDLTTAQTVAGIKTFSSDLKLETLFSLKESSGADTISVQAPASIASSYTLTLPIDDGTPSQYLQTNGSGVLSWQTIAASGDVVGPASATDNALARFDLTTGKLIQNSVGILSDAGALTGLTGVTTSGSLETSETLIESGNYANTQTGTSVNLTVTAPSVTRLTGGTLTSIAGVNDTTAGRRNIFINTSGNNVIVQDENTGTTAANRIRTGAGGDGVLLNNGAMETIYNTTTARHHVLSGLAPLGFIDATGCTITFNGNNKIHTCTANDTIDILQTSGAYNTITYVMVGGGGGGGSDSGGGGGAGEHIASNVAAVAGSYAVVIGNGGTGGTAGNVGSNGGNTTWYGITALGGGGGTNSGNGTAGGSGGGAGGNGGAASGGNSTATTGAGSAGGAAAVVASNRAGGGGGGAAGVGANAVGSSGGIGGAGGAGVATSITGSSVFRAAGGGGGNQSNTANALGGSSIGGNGADGAGNIAATAGATNTGSGGGGGAGGGVNATGGNGGSGVLIISYRYQ